MNIIELIRELIEFAFNNPNNLQRIIELGVVDEMLAEKIKIATGLNLLNYTISIDNFGLLHSLRKHGNNLKESQRGQIALNIEDFSVLQSIIFEADKIHIIKGNLVFEKTIGCHYFVVKEIRKVIGKKKILYKKNRLVFKTMYKRKSS